MKLIPLTQGMSAMVDDEDYELLSGFKWCALRGRVTFYAVRGTYKNGVKRLAFMHREMLGLSDPMEQVDHIDHNGLNNTRRNIRVSNHITNGRNKRAKFNSTSKFVGVSWCKRTRKWVAQIKHPDRKVFIGGFRTETEAAIARDLESIRYFGEFASLNVL